MSSVSARRACMVPGTAQHTQRVIPKEQVKRKTHVFPWAALQE